MYLAIVIYNIKLSDSLALRSLLNSGYSDVVLVYVNGECNFDMELSENFEIINNKIAIKLLLHIYNSNIICKYKFLTKNFNSSIFDYKVERNL